MPETKRKKLQDTKEVKMEDINLLEELSSEGKAIAVFLMAESKPVPEYIVDESIETFERMGDHQAYFMRYALAKNTGREETGRYLIEYINQAVKECGSHYGIEVALLENLPEKAVDICVKKGEYDLALRILEKEGMIEQAIDVCLKMPKRKGMDKALTYAEEHGMEEKIVELTYLDSGAMGAGITAKNRGLEELAEKYLRKAIEEEIEHGNFERAGDAAKKLGLKEAEMQLRDKHGAYHTAARLAEELGMTEKAEFYNKVDEMTLIPREKYDKYIKHVEKVKHFMMGFDRR